jgi:hypothetical protein
MDLARATSRGQRCAARIFADGVGRFVSSFYHPQSQIGYGKIMLNWAVYDEASKNVADKNHEIVYQFQFKKLKNKDGKQ